MVSGVAAVFPSSIYRRLLVKSTSVLMAPLMIRNRVHFYTLLFISLHLNTLRREPKARLQLRCRGRVSAEPAQSAQSCADWSVEQRHGVVELGTAVYAFERHAVRL